MGQSAQRASKLVQLADFMHGRVLVCISLCTRYSHENMTATDPTHGGTTLSTWRISPWWDFKSLRYRHANTVGIICQVPIEIYGSYFRFLSRVTGFYTRTALNKNSDDIVEECVKEIHMYLCQRDGNDLFENLLEKGKLLV